MKLDKIIFFTYGRKNLTGRNNFGRITTFHRGGGFKRKFRSLDFKRDLFFFIPATVKKIFYDFYRTGYVALICYFNGVLSYILASENMYKNYIINYNFYEPFFNYNMGSIYFMKDIPFSSFIYNVELYPSKGGQIARAAGVRSFIIRSLNSKYLVIQMPSGEQKAILAKCKATLGIVANKMHYVKSYKKAGISRNLNKRPIVRGVAMNAIDHPHGGGRGKTSGGKYLRTPWGANTKNVKTRKNLRTNFSIILKKKKIKWFDQFGKEYHF